MPDFLPEAHLAMVCGAVAINSTTVTAVRVGSTNLPDRKWLMIQMAVGGTVKVFIGGQSAVGTDLTKAELAKYGQKFGDGDRLFLPVGPNVTIYAICSTGAGKRLRVAEFA